MRYILLALLLIGCTTTDGGHITPDTVPYLINGMKAPSPIFTGLSVAAAFIYVSCPGLREGNEWHFGYSCDIEDAMSMAEIKYVIRKHKQMNRHVFWWDEKKQVAKLKEELGDNDLDVYEDLIKAYPQFGEMICKQLEQRGAKDKRCSKEKV